MVKMLPAHKVKINEAISHCEKAFTKLCEFLDRILTQGEASKVKSFLLQNTVFAGDVFRDILSGSGADNCYIHLYFTSLDAAIEFQHMYYSSRSLQEAFSFNEQGYMQIRLKAKLVASILEDLVLRFDISGDPDTILNKFPVSVNRHYFSLNSYQMRFDCDTFNKIGAVSAGIQNKGQTLYQVMNLMSDGYKITVASVLNALSPDSPDESEPDVSEVLYGCSPGNRITTFGLYYTEENYFECPSAKAEKASAPHAGSKIELISGSILWCDDRGEWHTTPTTSNQVDANLQATLSDEMSTEMLA